MMSGKDIIVHIINRDKFTSGYINFMKLRMSEWEHHFFTRDSGFDVVPVDDKNMYYFHDYDEILNSANITLLRECRKIIISGLWCNKLLRHMSVELMHKSYPHFWGGDFYGFRFSRMPKRNPIAILKWFVNRYYKHRFIKNCAGTVNLIEGDIEELCKVFPNDRKHFVAPMMGDPRVKYDFASFRARKKEGSALRILVGNSGAPQNEHISAFKKLEHLKDCDIEIVSPLSYCGTSEYLGRVIKTGHKIFGDKFKPVIDFIPREKYVEFLASFDVGVLNHNQQAAMGNISLLLRLGKKVYLREGTAMWKHYRENMKYTVYPVSELENISLQELVKFPPELAYNNIQIAEERASSNYAAEQWRKVFDN